MMRVAEQQRIETLKRIHSEHYDPQYCAICLLLEMIEEQKEMIEEQKIEEQRKERMICNLRNGFYDR